MLSLHRSTLLSLLLLPCLAQAAADPGLDAQILQLQSNWAEIRYATPKSQQDAAFTALEAQAADVAGSHPGQAEPLIWQAIILSTHAGVKGGLGALGRVKTARELLEQAERIDATAMHGSIYTSLGSLYYQVPGWPIGFGDHAKAEAYLKKALALNPDGIDPNFFYADYLYEQGRYHDAIAYLNKAITAPTRAHRELADKGRREEAQHLLAKVEAKLAK